jgi:hypothetical protein
MDKIVTQDCLASLNAKAETLGWQVRWSVATRFDDPELNRLLALWYEKAAYGFPTRSDFGLKQLKPVLPDVSIIERVHAKSGPRYRVRLVGTAIAQSFGEQTGKFIDDFVPSELMDRWAGGYDAILATGKPIRVVNKFALPQVNYLYGEALSAPLADSKGEPNLVLSVTYMSARPRDIES